MSRVKVLLMRSVVSATRFFHDASTLHAKTPLKRLVVLIACWILVGIVIGRIAHALGLRYDVAGVLVALGFIVTTRWLYRKEYAKRMRQVLEPRLTKYKR